MTLSRCRLALAATGFIVFLAWGCGDDGAEPLPTARVETRTATETLAPPPPTGTAVPTLSPLPTRRLPPTPTVPPPPASRITWQGGSYFLLGANLPWFNWGCDFGCGADGGVSSSAVSGEVGAAFQRLRAAGASVVRWWVFPGDAGQILRDATGAPAGLNPAVYADFDAALALADRYGVYYVFTIFSAPSAIPRAWLADPAQREKLVGLLGQLFARYGSSPRIISWEVVNEPEWDINRRAVSLADVQSLVREVAASVHANSKAYVTLGSANLSGLPLWKGLGLDYYSAHWYDPMAAGDCARCLTLGEVLKRYALDAPLTIGEFFAGTETDALAKLVDLYANGYAGAWAWSLLPNHTNDKLDIDLDAVRRFSGGHRDIGP